MMNRDSLLVGKISFLHNSLIYFSAGKKKKMKSLKKIVCVVGNVIRPLNMSLHFLSVFSMGIVK